MNTESFSEFISVRTKTNNVERRKRRTAWALSRKQKKLKTMQSLTHSIFYNIDIYNIIYLLILNLLKHNIPTRIQFVLFNYTRICYVYSVAKVCNVCA